MNKLIRTNLRKYLTEGKKNTIDVKELEKMAKGIELVCDGEYGATFYQPDSNSVFICVGDSHPFNLSDLKEFILNAIVDDYDDREKVNIEIEHESYPKEENGWLVYKNDNFETWEGHFR